MPFRKMILDEWAKDCKFDSLRLQETNDYIPTLHSKFLKFQQTAREELRAAKMAESSLRKALTNYYRAKSNTKEELTRLKRPIQLEAVLVATLPAVLDADPEMQKAQLLTGYWSDAFDLTKSIMDSISGRGYLVHNSIDLIKLKAGR